MIKRYVAPAIALAALNPLGSDIHAQSLSARRPVGHPATRSATENRLACHFGFNGLSGVADGIYNRHPGDQFDRP